jgi:Rrf2 family protein
MSKLVKIPESVSLALHSMAVLAERSDEIVTTRDIAEILGASSAHLAKVLKTLEHTGYVHSTRGPAGGFQLAVDPDQVTLMEIYTAIEGPLRMEECLLSSSICSGGQCIFGEILESLERQFRENLENTKLSELADTVGVFNA